MTGPVTERRLWVAFALLFGVVASSVALPVRPLVFVFPFWAAVVLAAAVATVVVALVAVRFGWPGAVEGDGDGAVDGDGDGDGGVRGA